MTSLHKPKVTYIKKRCTRPKCKSDTMVKEGSALYCKLCGWHYSRQGSGRGRGKAA